MKNKLKNICSVLLIMACMFTLTSCKEVENAEKAVTDFMTAIQNCDYETMALMQSSPCSPTAHCLSSSFKINARIFLQTLPIGKVS